MLLPGHSTYITVNGIRVRLLETGEGSPVILLHGLGATMATWRDNIAPLAARHKVYAIDLPGHGDSDKPDASYDLPSMVGFARALIAELGYERVALAGSSMGGGLAVMTARHFPDAVSKLVLSASAGLGREVAAFLRLATLPALGELMSSGVGWDSVRIWLRKCFYDKSLATDDLIREMRRVYELPGAKRAALRISRTYIGAMGVRRGYFLTSALRDIRAPAVIFWGANDEILPPKHGIRAAASMPSADLHVFGNCGHWVHVERADMFNALTLEFLSRKS